jgi:hypothetical protein
MIRIAITVEAYEAIARTLALGTLACEPQPNENGERLIWMRNVGSTSSIPSGAPARATRRPSSGSPRCGKDTGHTSDAEQARRPARPRRQLQRFDRAGGGEQSMIRIAVTAEAFDAIVATSQVAA